MRRRKLILDLFDYKEMRLLSEISGVKCTHKIDEDGVCGLSEGVKIDKPLVLKAVIDEYKGLKNMKARKRLINDLRVDSKQKAILMIKLLFLSGHITEEVMRAALSTIEMIPREKSSIHSELLLKMPFGITLPIKGELKDIKKRLDRCVYGMEEAKRSILNYIVFMKHSKGTATGLILLLVGPPGTGKTTLAQGVADAFGVPMVKISFAGNFDMALFRGGHPSWGDTTYGAIVKEIADAGCENPVIVLDEIDKCGGSSAGDIIHILAELLDPNQSCSFTDLFLGVPVNLSKAVFIATANELDLIPGYVRDRCNVIHVKSPSRDEKKKIVKMIVEQVKKEKGLRFDAVLDDEFVNKLLDVEESPRKIKELIISHIAQIMIKIGDKCPAKLKLVEFDESLVEKKEEGLKRKRQIGFRR